MFDRSKLQVREHNEFVQSFEGKAWISVYENKGLIYFWIIFGT